MFAHALWVAHGRKGYLWVIHGHRWAHFYYKRANGVIVDVYGSTSIRWVKANWPYKYVDSFEVIPVATFKQRNKKHGHNGGHVTAALRHIRKYPKRYLR